jgi:iron uptake system component EfeO
MRVLVTVFGRLAGLRAVLAIALTMLVCMAGAGVWLGLHHSPRQAGSGTTVEISASNCGQGWASPHAGLQTINLHNDGDAAAEAYLIKLPGGAIYGEVDNLGPNTTDPLLVRLGDGTYAFRCIAEDVNAVMGPHVTIRGGSANGGPAAPPVTENELLGPLRTYQAYVGAGLAELSGQVRTVAADVGSGNLAQARTDWLPAHMTYERLGAAYGTFGDYDAAIDGRADGLPAGVQDPSFQGFHRLEYGLWNGQSNTELTPVVNQLVQSVGALQAAWPSMEIDPIDLGLRAHEIMENALQFSLSGDDDYGSGTGLATISANLTGTTELLTILHPLLVTRDRDLGQSAWMTRTEQLVSSFDGAQGWTPVADLSIAQREDLEGTIDGLLQRLATVATTCEVRRTT